MPNFSQISSEMAIFPHLTRLNNQLTNQPLPIDGIALMQGSFRTSMPTFSQISTETAILAH